MALAQIKTDMNLMRSRRKIPRTPLVMKKKAWMLSDYLQALKNRKYQKVIKFFTRIRPWSSRYRKCLRKKRFKNHRLGR
jgi:hypothetical protein